MGDGCPLRADRFDAEDFLSRPAVIGNDGSGDRWEVRSVDARS
jgi:hypothetical protein